MTDATVVRYRTHPEAGDENARLVAAVYAALAETDPGNFRYTTYRLDDGVTFVHVAERSGAENPLFTLPAFAEFQRDLPARCAELPQSSSSTIVGSYGWKRD